MERKKSYDVIVVGGGAAGLAAAIGAKKAGASCLLLERSGCLGGQATNSNVASYCGFFTRGEEPEQIVRGVGEEVLQKLKKLGFYNGYKLSTTKNAIVTLDIEATKVVFDQMITEYEVDCLMHCRVIEARKDEKGERILSVLCVDDEGYCEFSANTFVDATGDANLGALAGAPFRFGDGNGGAYMTTRVMRIDQVEPAAVFKPALLEEAFLQAKADGFCHLTKESGIVFRTNEDTVAAILPSVELLSLDCETMTACEIDTRRQSLEYLAAFRKYVPGMEHCRLVWTGNVLGTRDTRHLQCEDILTESDVLNAVKREDGIARGGWPCEMHLEKTKIHQYRFIKDDSYYDIPLGCLKVQKIKNLWAAGRTIQADPVAFASVRVMGTGFATGHAAGVAAALTTIDGDYEVKRIQEELRRQDACI